jgi:hypothetical protein
MGRIRVGENNLLTTHPLLAAEALFDATTVSRGSHSRLPWRCPAGHEYQAVVKDRTSGTGCPYCSGNKVLPGFNDLATVRPDLVAEARFEASNFTAGSKVKVDWECAEGHKWTAAIGERVNGTGCPACSTWTVHKGHNDLATLRPDLAVQAQFDASKVGLTSKQEVPWRCNSGHGWSTSIASRVAQDACPYCVGVLPVVGESDLMTTHPDIAIEAAFDPTSVTALNTRVKRWICSRDHQWKASTADRLAGHKCPYCASGKEPLASVPLTVSHPELAVEAQFDASKVSAGSGRKLPWRCAKGHEWSAIVANRAHGIGCPICSNKAVLEGYNDLATTNPALAAEALFDATSVTAGSANVLEWRCPQGHEYASEVSARSRGRGCPYCSGNAVLVGFNDLATLEPELALEALFDPQTVSTGSNYKLPWRCSEGHEWEAVVGNRVNGAGCPVCTNRIALPGFNDLATLNPELAAQAVFDPTTVTIGSTGTRLPWRCSLGHEWIATVASRSAGRGCPFCAGKAVLSGFNDLATVAPDLAAEARFDATTVTAGSSERLPWLCVLGHEWEATPKDRQRTGCPFCSGNRVLPGFNDLATVRPDLAEEALFDATTVTSGSHAQLSWRCAFGHEWKAAPNARSRGTGCPTCTPYGFDPSENGWLYLMVHEDWRMLQVGITNDPETRLNTHGKNGWTPRDLRGPLDGVLAAEWERSILRFLRDRGITLVPSGVSDEPVKPQGDLARRTRGEAWWNADFEASTIRELMELVDEHES